MPLAATSLSLSPGIWSQCRPLSVLDKESTREMGRELEFPKTWGMSVRAGTLRAPQQPTPMAMTKLRGRFWKLKSRDIKIEHA